MQNSEVLALIRLVRVIAGDRIFPFPALNLEKTSSVARSIITLTITPPHDHPPDSFAS